MKLAKSFIGVLTGIAAVSLLGGSADAASLSLGGLTGTFPSYTDPGSGITITWTSHGGSVRSGSTVDGKGQPDYHSSGGPGNEPHLSMGPSDLVTLDFSAASTVVPGTVVLKIFDLDQNGTGTRERLTVTDAIGPNTHIGLASPIANSTALAGGFTDAVDISGGTVTLQMLNPSGGHAAFDVTFDQVPEPSSVLLIGLGGLAFALRRRR